jgi:GNAT superfamily N-acetyltransferase
MYTLLPAQPDPAILVKYAALLGRVFNNPTRFNLAYLQWLYADNPAGGVVGTDAWADDGTLAAHYATVPVAYNWAGQHLQGLLSLNTATDAAHQGKGLFTKLAAATYDAATSAGYDFVVGVANQNSTHGFVRKIGFSHLGALEAKLCFAPPKFPEKGPLLARHFDTATLAWRLANPCGRYYQHAGRIYAPTGVPGLGAALSGHIAAPSDLPRKGKLLSLWLGHVPARKFASAAVEIPAWLRPSPLNLIYLKLRAEAAPRASEICLEALDFDAY